MQAMNNNKKKDYKREEIIDKMIEHILLDVF